MYLQWKKGIAVFALLIILFSLLGSAEVLAHYHHHECSGENCHVCMVLKEAQNVLSHWRLLSILLSLLVLGGCEVVRKLGTEAESKVSNTLYSRNVLLLN